MASYEVVVGNIGTVHVGRLKREALRVFAHYVDQSKSGRGRAGGEDVTLLKDNEIAREHTGNLSDWTDQDGDGGADEKSTV